MTLIAVVLISINAILCVYYVAILGRHGFLHYKFRGQHHIMHKAFSTQHLGHSVRDIRRSDINQTAVMAAHGALLVAVYEWESAIIVALCAAAIGGHVLNRRIEQMAGAFGHTASAGSGNSEGRRSSDRRSKQNEKPRSERKTDPGSESKTDQRWSTSDAEKDYQNALQEAQIWADEASNKESATARIKLFEKKLKSDIHPKDILRYQLAIMLLKEKIKSLE